MKDLSLHCLWEHVLTAELSIQTSILEAALTACPHTTIEVERGRSIDDGKAIQLLLWVKEGGDDEFEAAVVNDSSITEVKQFSEDTPREDGVRSLYRVEFTEAAITVAPGSAWIERGVILLDAVGTFEGWEVRLLVPDREALTSSIDWWQANFGSVSVDALYSSADDSGGTGLTSLQYDALLRALETGYFDVPRRTTLEELADEFDISAQALSVRLRKGTATLVGNSVTEDPI